MTKSKSEPKADEPKRSDVTRTKILAFARQRFAASGFERTTIRAIAADAGVDPALVMHYFGSKDALFSVAAELDLHLPNLSGAPRAQAGAAMVRHFLDRWESDEALKTLLRSAATNDAAAERMRALFARQLRPAIAQICPDDKLLNVRAGLVATQMMGFAFCRYVLRLPPVSGLSKAEVIAWIGPTLQHYLFGNPPC